MDSGTIRYCRQIIDNACGLIKNYPEIKTAVHLVVPAETERFGHIALKIGLRHIKTLGSDPANKRGVEPLREIAALNKLADHPDLAVPVLASAEDGSWFIRPWIDGEVLADVGEFTWTNDHIVKIWSLFEKVFDIYHNAPEPWLIRDIKPSNVLVMKGKFALFDFSTTRPLDEVNALNRRDRLGTRSGRYWAPELLSPTQGAIGVNSDYFSFATTLYQSVRQDSGPVWKNKVAGQEESARAYALEYEKVRLKLPKAFRKFDLDKAHIEFLVRCMNPNPEHRPKRFLSMNSTDRSRIT